jgi:iron complex transport system ATP-binding protein
MTELIARDLTSAATRRGAAAVLDGCNLGLYGGDLVAVIGPNGAGKSSLLRAIAGQLSHSGHVTIDGRDARAMPPAARARAIGYLPQRDETVGPVRVDTMVGLGRYAWGASPGRLSPEDQRAVDAAIAETGCGAIATRTIDTLSGGERARAALARVFAAQTPVLLLDEPVAALDPAYQIASMRLIRGRADAGAAVLAVLHDINLAVQFADRILWMDRGQIIAETPANDPLIAGQFRKLFDADILTSGDGGGRIATAALVGR